MLTGATEAILGPDTVFCETCGSSTNVHKEQCRGCNADHCDVCLWRRHGQTEKGWCALCVMCPKSRRGSIDNTRMDKATLDLAQKDVAFMSWADRLGEAWETAEKKLSAGAIVVHPAV